MDQLPDDHDDLSQTIREAEKVIYARLGEQLGERLVRFSGLWLDWRRATLAMAFDVL